METDFRSSIRGDRLHARVTALLARQVIEAERCNTAVVFPKEADLCRQLGVSRTVLRESMKVLADKGMIEMKPRVGTRARPRSEWRLLEQLKPGTRVVSNTFDMGDWKPEKQADIEGADQDAYLSTRVFLWIIPPRQDK